MEGSIEGKERRICETLGIAYDALAMLEREAAMKLAVVIGAWSQRDAELLMRDVGECLFEYGERLGGREIELPVRQRDAAWCEAGLVAVNTILDAFDARYPDRKACSVIVGAMIAYRLSRRFEGHA